MEPQLGRSGMILVMPRSLVEWAAALVASVNAFIVARRIYLLVEGREEGSDLVLRSLVLITVALLMIAFLVARHRARSN